MVFFIVKIINKFENIIPEILYLQNHYNFYNYPKNAKNSNKCENIIPEILYLQNHNC
jgi:hypothetical protein